MTKKKIEVFVRDEDLEKGKKRFYVIAETIRRPFEKVVVLFCRKKDLKCEVKKRTGKNGLWRAKDEEKFFREFTPYENGMFDEAIEQSKKKRERIEREKEKEKRLRILSLKIKKQREKEKDERLALIREKIEKSNERKLRKLVANREVEGVDSALVSDVQRLERIKAIKERKKLEREKQERIQAIKDKKAKEKLEDSKQREREKLGKENLKKFDQKMKNLKTGKK